MNRRGFLGALLSAALAPLVALKASVFPKPDPINLRVIQSWHHPGTGEWIGLVIFEEITREEFSRRYPNSAVRNQTKEKA